jgi:hypothetical protein
MNDEQHKKLAKLVTYIIEHEVWKHSYLHEQEYTIRLFTMETKIPYRRTIHYVNRSLKKLIGKEYSNTQSHLNYILMSSEPDDFAIPSKKKLKPRTKVKSRTNNITPRTEFGKKFSEHFGIRSSENLSLYLSEYRIYQELGRCSWEQKENRE